MSAQVLKLEARVGLPLFQRKPFLLTPAGKRLFAEIAPFFEKVNDLGPALRGDFSHRLRLVAPARCSRSTCPTSSRP